MFAQLLHVHSNGRPERQCAVAKRWSASRRRTAPALRCRIAASRSAITIRPANSEKDDSLAHPDCLPAAWNRQNVVADRHRFSANRFHRKRPRHGCVRDGERQGGPRRSSRRGAPRPPQRLDGHLPRQASARTVRDMNTAKTVECLRRAPKGREHGAASTYLFGSGARGTSRAGPSGTEAPAPVIQSAPAGTAAGLRRPGSRAPAVAATMAAAPSQTYSRSKPPLESKTHPASMTVRPATPSASTNFAP